MYIHSFIKFQMFLHNLDCYESVFHAPLLPLMAHKLLDMQNKLLADKFHKNFDRHNELPYQSKIFLLTNIITSYAYTTQFWWGKL